MSVLLPVHRERELVSSSRGVARGWEDGAAAPTKIFGKMWKTYLIKKSGMRGQLVWTLSLYNSIE